MPQHDAKDSLAVLPWFWRDWRACTARAVLMAFDPASVTAYRELLEAMWGTDDCALPDDDATLCALAGVGEKCWRRVRQQVLRWLPKGVDGKRRQPRLSHEWAKAMTFRSKCRAGGLATAAKRYGGPPPESGPAAPAPDRSPPGSPPSSQAVARLPLGNAPPYRTPSPSPSPTPRRRRIPDPERAREARLATCAGDGCTDPLCCSTGLEAERTRKRRFG